MRNSHKVNPKSYKKTYNNKANKTKKLNLLKAHRGGIKK